MEHIKRKHEDYLRYRWRDVAAMEGRLGGLLVALDVEPPLPACLLEKSPRQFLVGGYVPNVQEWHLAVDENEDGDVVRAALTYTGTHPASHRHARDVELRVRRPRAPGRLFPVSAGPARATVVRNVLGHEDPPDEIECPACDVLLSPVPESCPSCGHRLEQETPTLGELVDRYGRGAVLEVHTGYADADLVVVYERTEEQAAEETRARRARHDESVALHQLRAAAWDRVTEPSRRERRAEQEARELAELERLRAKYPEAGTGGT